MAAGAKDNSNQADDEPNAPSQSLAALPRPASVSSSPGIGGFYDDGLDDLAPEPAQAGRTGWLWLLGFLLLLAATFTFGALAERSSTKPPPVGPFASSPSVQTGALVVHVTGRVKTPGVYNLPFEARVNDAIAKAGGALPDADLNAVNLAAWAEDGARIEVPAKAIIAAPRVAQVPITEAPAPKLESLPEAARSTPALSRAVEIAPIAKKSPARPKAAPRPAKVPLKKKDEVPRDVTTSGAESQNASPEYLAKHPIDLNRATAEQLQMLPGVGPAMADKIIAYRKESGRFNAVEDLDKIRGIGAKTLEKLRPLVTVK